MPSDEILFNHEIAMDLMWLDNDPVFHVIDTHKIFQNAAFIRGKTLNELLESFLSIRVTLFIGYPETYASIKSQALTRKRYVR